MVSNAITNCARFKMGEGKTTSFWEDFWVRDRPLKLQFSCLYKLSNREEGKVSDMGLCLNEYGHGSFISIRNYFF
jgi:hypothetical protein